MIPTPRRWVCSHEVMPRQILRLKSHENLYDWDKMSLSEEDCRHPVLVLYHEDRPIIGNLKRTVRICQLYSFHGRSVEDFFTNHADCHKYLPIAPKKPCCDQVGQLKLISDRTLFKSGYVRLDRGLSVNVRSLKTYAAGTLPNDFMLTHESFALVAKNVGFRYKIPQDHGKTAHTESAHEPLAQAEVTHAPTQDHGQSMSQMRPAAVEALSEDSALSFENAFENALLSASARDEHRNDTVVKSPIAENAAPVGIPTESQEFLSPPPSPSLDGLSAQESPAAGTNHTQPTSPQGDNASLLVVMLVACLPLVAAAFFAMSVICAVVAFILILTFGQVNSTDWDTMLWRALEMVLPFARKVVEWLEEKKRNSQERG